VRTLDVRVMSHYTNIQLIIFCYLQLCYCRIFIYWILCQLIFVSFSRIKLFRSFDLTFLSRVFVVFVRYFYRSLSTQVSYHYCPGLPALAAGQAANHLYSCINYLQISFHKITTILQDYIPGQSCSFCCPQNLT